MQLTGGVWSATKKNKILSLLIGLFFFKVNCKIDYHKRELYSSVTLSLT